MGISHLTFYSERNITAKDLTARLGINRIKAWKLITGKDFFKIDQYKILESNHDIKVYLSMKDDFEYNNQQSRVEIHKDSKAVVYFYPKIYKVIAFDYSMTEIWSKSCLNAEDAKLLWNQFE